MSSNVLCKACTLLEGLERGVSNAGVVRLFPVFSIIQVIEFGHRMNGE